MDITSLRVPGWAKYDGLLHGFFGRRGGKSGGTFSGLNVSYRVGDDPEIVSQNVCDMKLAVGIHEGRVVTMKQVHGADIVEVNDTNLKEAGEADGMITSKPNIFLGVLTADCVPVLLIAPVERVVSVVHCGWRGSLAGIAAKAVNRFSDVYGVAPSTLEAALGPSIGACCYEVGDDVVEPLRARWGALAEASIKNSAVKSHIDLRGLNRDILTEAGLRPDRVFEIGPCSKCAAEDYFSYRREGRETGRQMSVIGWQA